MSERDRELAARAYELLVNVWGVDGDADLREVATWLSRANIDRAIKSVDQVIESQRASLRASLALRTALSDGSIDAIVRLKSREDITDIFLWPEPIECGEGEDE